MIQLLTILSLKETYEINVLLDITNVLMDANCYWDICK